VKPQNKMDFDQNEGPFFVAEQFINAEIEET
jgi:hypothetical protein